MMVWREEMATHSSILAGKIPWTEEPGGLQYVGLQRVGHDLTTKQNICVLKLSFQAHAFELINLYQSMCNNKTQLDVRCHS